MTDKPAGRISRVGLAGMALISSICLVPPMALGEAVVLKADRVFVGDGRVIESGAVLVVDGRIRAVGADLRIPDDATIIQVEGGCVSPGLIDANARVGAKDLIAPEPRSGGYGEEDEDHGEPDDDDSQDEVAAEGHVEVGEEEDLLPTAAGVASSEVVNEQSSEVVPQIRVLDAIDLRSGDFDRLVRGGVTTVYASPDASAVIGARGAVLHTAGPRAKRVIVPAAAVKATIGAEPSMLGTYNTRPSRMRLSMYARRPNSRMGLVWVFRKAFYDAVRLRDGLPVYGADTASPEALAVVLDVIEGHTPMRIQARIQQDILAAIRLAEEFQLSFTLEEATEAYLCLEELRQASVPVIFGPIYDRPSGSRATTGEGKDSRLDTFSKLLKARIPTALSAQELRDDDGLARQAMCAQRYGVDFNAALKSVTATPAQLLGLADQLGTVKPGKRADLVLWSGRPFSADSKPVVVLIDGEVVWDGRTNEEISGDE